MNYWTIAPRHKTFVGHLNLSDTWCAQLRREPHRPLWVKGPPGIGKSALLRHLSERLGSFCHDCAWISLRSVSRESHLTCHIAQALDCDPSLDSITAQIKSSPRALLLIDDIPRHLVDRVVALIKELSSACPKLLIVCASVYLHKSADLHTLNMPPLSLKRSPSTPSDAAQLFLHHYASSTQPPTAFAHEDIEALVQELGGMPLAIELAAHRACLIGVEALKRYIRSDLGILSQELLDRSTRHRSIRGPINEIWEGLSTSERELLAQCAAIREPFHLQELLHLTQLNPAILIGLLDGLVEAQTLVVHTQYNPPQFEVLHLFITSFEQNAFEDVMAIYEKARARHLDLVLDAMHHEIKDFFCTPIPIHTFNRRVHRRAQRALMHYVNNLEQDHRVSLQHIALLLCLSIFSSSEPQHISAIAQDITRLYEFAHAQPSATLSPLTHQLINALHQLSQWATPLADTQPTRAFHFSELLHTFSLIAQKQGWQDTHQALQASLKLAKALEHPDVPLPDHMVTHLLNPPHVDSSWHILWSLLASRWFCNHDHHTSARLLLQRLPSLQHTIWHIPYTIQEADLCLSLDQDSSRAAQMLTHIMSPHQCPAPSVLHDAIHVDLAEHLLLEGKAHEVVERMAPLLRPELHVLAPQRFARVLLVLLMGELFSHYKQNLKPCIDAPLIMASGYPLHQVSWWQTLCEHDSSPDHHALLAALCYAINTHHHVLFNTLFPQLPTTHPCATILRLYQELVMTMDDHLHVIKPQLLEQAKRYLDTLHTITPKPSPGVLNVYRWVHQVLRHVQDQSRGVGALGTTHHVQISWQHKHILLDGKTLIKLNKRPKLYELLRTLHTAYQRQEAASVEEIIEHVWRGEILAYDAAQTRLYSLLSSARRLGMRELIMHTKDGYCFSPEWRVVELDDHTMTS